MNKGKWIVNLVLLIVLFMPVSVHAYNDDLMEMLDVRSESGWTEEVHAMVNHLNQVDARILRHSNIQDVRIILMDKPLTQLPEFQHLTGLVPRGWSDTGLTWDEVPGAGGQVVAARIGYSEPGNGHSVVNLELHEFGHAVDEYAAGFQISHSSEFMSIHSEEQYRLMYDHTIPAYFDQVDEYFAEAFAMYHTDGSRDILRERAPKTYYYMSTLHNRLITIEGQTFNTVDISFTPFPDATYYVLYRNAERLGEVDEGYFHDSGLKESSRYQYYYKAFNSEHQELFSSFYNTALTLDEPDDIDNDIVHPYDPTDEEIKEEALDVPTIEEEMVAQGTHYSILHYILTSLIGLLTLAMAIVFWARRFT